MKKTKRVTMSVCCPNGYKTEPHDCVDVCTRDCTHPPKSALYDKGYEEGWAAAMKFVMDNVKAMPR